MTSKQLWLRYAVTALVLVLLVVWWQGGASKRNPSATTAPSATSLAVFNNQRTRNDLQSLARAFSAVAARTIGLVMVSGRVLDRASGQAIPHAEVVFSGPTGEASMACDEQGRYQIELEPGFYRSYARAENYVAVAQAAAERLPGAVSAAAVAMPREGIAPLAGLFRDQVGVDLSLSPGATLRGQVVDGEGRSIAGAIIAAKSSHGLRVISGSDVSESDGSGQFELHVLAGRNHLEARHDDYASLRSASQVDLRAGELRKDFTLVMDAGCIVEGWVVDSDGNRVESGSFERQIIDALYTPVGEIENGRVRFATDLQGSVVLRAWPWKSPPTASKEYRCTGDDHYRDEVFVVPESEPALTGYVEDHEGQRAALAFVDLFSLEPGGPTQQERADASGDFAFFNLPKGAYQLSVYVPGKGVTLQIIDVPSSGVPLRLSGTGSIIGSVEDVEFGSMSMQYRCLFQGGANERARADALSMPMQTLLVPLNRGRFRIDDLPACPLHARVRIGGFSDSFDIDIQAGREAPLRLGDES